jgi:putative membrane protein
MIGFLLRLLVVAVGLWLASRLLPGLQISGAPTLLGAALLLGIVNAVVRPLVVLLTLPITVVTLGLFLLVVNGAMLWLVSRVFDGFIITDLWSAVLGALIVGLTAWLGSYFIGPRGKIDLIVVRRRR